MSTRSVTLVAKQGSLPPTIAPDPLRKAEASVGGGTKSKTYLAGSPAMIADMSRLLLVVDGGADEEKDEYKWGLHI
jgi:hypothetical protein